MMAGWTCLSQTIRCRISFCTMSMVNASAEVGMQTGVALNDDGKAISSMGADFQGSE